MRDDDLWDMSDDDLEAAFKEAKAQEESPETEIESTVSQDDDAVEEEIVEDTEELDEEDSQDSDDVEGGPDQPEDELEESDDHDASEDSETEDVVDEDTSDSDEEESDEDSDSEDDETSSDDDDDAEEDEQPVQKYTFRANGKDYEFSGEEVIDQFPKIFGQAMDYTKKMQTIKPWRKTIDALEGAELDHKDVSLMIDVLKGNKEAITEVIKRTGYDALEYDAEADSGYVAKDYGRDDSALAIKDVIDVIKQDPEYETTHSILSSQWDDKSWKTMSDNPEMIRLLHTDVKNGMYAKLQPVAEKLKVFDGAAKSDLEYYKLAAQQHFAQEAEQEALEKRNEERQAKRAAKEAEQAKLASVKADDEKRKATKKASGKRKAAAPTKAVASGRGVIDYLDDDDEAFEEWYKNLQDSV